MTYSRLVSRPMLLVLLSLLNTTIQAASPLTINKAAYDKKTGKLTIATTSKSGGNLTLLHSGGGILATEADVSGKHSVVIPLAQLGQIPCSVEARVGETAVSKSVTGAPAECKKLPTCEILAPVNGAQLKINTAIDFKAKAQLKDKAAGPLTYEWDFAGGVFDNSHPATLEAKGIKFVRDHSRYRVRFAARDSLQRRCEAAVEVVVGTPPDIDLPKVAEQASAVRGEETNGVADDLVVLPFQEWSMQHTSDMRQQPIGYDSFNHLFNTLNAYVLRKGSVGNIDKPRLLGRDSINLRYSAASNPLDPVGMGSINSTSQNWPLNGDGSKPALFMAPTTTLKKTDVWELHPTRPVATLDPNYRNWSAIQAIFAWGGLHNAIPGLPAPDEGYYPHATPPLEGEQTPDYYGWYLEQYEKFQTLKLPGTEHGSYMPGKADPYTANDPQPFTDYDIDQQWFRAPTIPITDVDDRGRINPYNLMRIEAVEENAQPAKAKTDVVLSTSRDFHCRECHAKGKIAANPNAGYTAAAFLSSPKGQDPWYFEYRNSNYHPEKPTFYEATGNTLYDQEYAASLNYASLHDYYDGYDFVGSMINGGGSLWSFHNSLAKEDTPKTCNGCHYTPVEAMFRKETFWIGAPYDNTNLYYNPDYSMSMHRFHGEMQYNADKTDILRNEKGAYARFDWKKLTQRQPGKDPNPKTLFPIFGPDGKQLPMEENCLKCHAGHREPLYNDRMATAGVTCYDCHGDMLAMGRAFPKQASKIGSSKNEDYRIAWFDQTDCGSCHTGKGSEAVKTAAFDSADLSATSRSVDHNNPNAVRFAIVPLYQKELEAYTYKWDLAGNNGEGADVDDYTPLTVKSPLYKFGKDQHGNLACAACHGAAHAIGPNRDPKSNDNVTALQLQGYPGPITECNVCHTQDAFSKLENSGSTLHYPDKNGGATILAGPHNLHPVNDPYWWQQAPGDTVDSTPNVPKRKEGAIKGGWHNDWAKLPGLNGEDQCAACHGSDHKGTRLSKVPVDRQLIDEKGKSFTVPAGTPIACDMCHSIEKSCTGSPVGAKCGTVYVNDPVKPGDSGATHQAPIISSKPKMAGLNVDADYSYQVVATQADHLQLTYSLVGAPTGMSINASTGLITWKAQALAGGKATFQIKVTDTAQGEATQTISVTVCASPKKWDNAMAMCM